ncbi:DNA mismatch repair protein MutT [Catellatospora sp. TT07R-123]|uniref:NUDIX hydrolase n=1 Tax=Catellatospora sp. TT07R-123 TaxID=2733863 RepID=UPI001AFD27D8|nr:NUDIX domain-containing protein [Catellatospora sp. TT07R-123]GHJ49804.1 DNA mismatch repair protein MutT [Catellatospora sp. TT07R-123]
MSTEPRQEPRPRRAGRVLLVDARERVLLFHGTDPHQPGAAYWFTPGGGLDDGETTAQAAARELFEETGLSVPVDRIGPAVHSEVANFSFAGVAYRQEQDFYLVRVDSWHVDTSRFDEVEQASVDGHRWWSVSELRETGEVYFPADLTSVLAAAGVAGC